jgi:hypothetical protein
MAAAASRRRHGPARSSAGNPGGEWRSGLRPLAEASSKAPAMSARCQLFPSRGMTPRRAAPSARSHKLPGNDRTRASRHPPPSLRAPARGRCPRARSSVSRLTAPEISSGNTAVGNSAAEGPFTACPAGSESRRRSPGSLGGSRSGRGNAGLPKTHCRSMRRQRDQGSASAPSRVSSPHRRVMAQPATGRSVDAGRLPEHAVPPGRRCWRHSRPVCHSLQRRHRLLPPSRRRGWPFFQDSPKACAKLPPDIGDAAWSPPSKHAVSIAIRRDWREVWLRIGGEFPALDVGRRDLFAGGR